MTLILRLMLLRHSSRISQHLLCSNKVCTNNDRSRSDLLSVNSEGFFEWTGCFEAGFASDELVAALSVVGVLGHLRKISSLHASTNLGEILKVIHALSGKANACCDRAISWGRASWGRSLDEGFGVACVDKYSVHEVSNSEAG